MKKYYYCTTKTYFKTAHVLKSIIEVFEDRKEQELCFNDVYSALRDKLFVSSVNKKNLQDLLNTADKVTLDEVRALYDQCAALYQGDEAVDDEPFEEYYVISKHNIIKKVDVFKFLKEIFIEQQEDQIKLSDVKVALAQKLNCANVNMDSLKTLLKSTKPYVTREEVEMLAKEFDQRLYQELEDMENRKIANVRAIIQQTHIDNKDIPLEYVVNPALLREFCEIGIKTIGELAQLSDLDLRHLIAEREKPFAELLKLLPESYRVKIDNDFYKYVICGINRKTGKKSLNSLKYIDVMNRRVKGSTLQDAGATYGLTRERVRQIENKFIDRFDDFVNHLPCGIVNLLRMSAQNKNYITKIELASTIHQCVEIFWYLLKECGCEEIAHVEELDVFALVDGLNWYDEIEALVAQLPTMMLDSEMETRVCELYSTFKQLGVEIEMGVVESVVKHPYRKHGTMYSKNRITKQEKYLQVLKKHHPEGIRVYDDEQLDLFRKHYIKMFDVDDLSSKNRAIRSTISRVASVKDRGIYVALENTQIISNQLLADICQYIEESKKVIFMINTLFYVFKDRLTEEGICNRYKLQWILVKKLGHKYHLSRDYLSKDKSVTSVYRSIVNFIRDAGRIVTKQELRNEFPGIPDNVFAFALADENIIVGLGTYAHKEYVEKFKVSLQFIAREMSKIADDGEIHNCQELFDILKNELPAIIEEINIPDRYFLFSVMEEFWADKFEFRRPFFAKLGVYIAKQDERIRDLVNMNIETDISDLKGFINENSFVVNSLLELIDGLDDIVVFKDKDTLIKIENTMLTEDIQVDIDAILDLQIGKSKLPSKVNDFSSLPSVGIDWNEWLLYSVVKKWSKKYIAETTSNIFSMAEPRFMKK